MSEENRILDTYRNYSCDKNYSYLWNPLRSNVALYYNSIWQMRIGRFFLNERLQADKVRILDAGCGIGDKVGYLIMLGFLQNNIVGIDLFPDDLAIAKKKYAGVKWIDGNCNRMEFADESFDYILASTLFSSVLCLETKKSIATEFKRVLKRTGKIIWLDLNEKTKIQGKLCGLSKRNIVDLFGKEMNITVKPVYLKMDLVARIAPYSYALCNILEFTNMWNQSLFGTISKKNNSFK